MISRIFFAIFLVVALMLVQTPAQTTGFSYQGKLNVSGSPANGNYDFEFRLYDSLGGGTQIGALQTRSNVLVTDGIFSVTLDFGEQFPGSNRFLDINVRPNSGGAFTLLTPRQQVASSPYSIQTINSQMLGGVPASSYVQTTDARLSDARTPLPGSPNYIQNTTTSQAADFNVNGSGFAGSLNIGTTVTVNGSATGATAPSGRGRFFFDATTNKFRVSENGSAYVDLVGSGGVSGSGTVNTIPLWSAGTTLGSSLISQSGTSILMPNVVTFGTSLSGHFAQMGSPNSESGLTFSGPGARADIRYNGALKIVNGTGGVQGPSNGISIGTTGNVAVGSSEFATGKLQVLGGTSQPGVYAQTDNRALWGRSTGGGYGVYGESVSGIGVQGVSTANIGTVGESSTNIGVYGNTASTSATAPGVRGVSTGNGGVGVRGDGTTGVYGTSATGTGVTGETTSANGFGVYASNPNGRAFYAAGHAGQQLDKFGLPKAMLYVAPDGTILSCYNGVTGASTPATCGFSVSIVGSSYFVDFPFQVFARPAVATSGLSGSFFTIASLEHRPLQQSRLVVAPFIVSSSELGFADFSLVVY